MTLPDVGVEIVKALLPPKEPNDEQEQQRWRWVVFSALIALGVALIVHIILACGLVPNVFPGFAPATSVMVIRRRVDLIATESLERTMRDKLQERCAIRDSKNSRDIDIRRDLGEDLDRLERDYYDINKSWFAQPACGDL